jgi:hypothetical protein
MMQSQRQAGQILTRFKEHYLSLPSHCSVAKTFKILVSLLLLDVEVNPMITVAMCFGSVDPMWVADPRQAVTRSAETASQDSISEPELLEFGKQQYGWPTTAILMAYAIQASESTTITRFDSYRKQLVCKEQATKMPTSLHHPPPIRTPRYAAIRRRV